MLCGSASHFLPELAFAVLWGHLQEKRSPTGVQMGIARLGSRMPSSVIDHAVWLCLTKDRGVLGAAPDELAIALCITYLEYLADFQSGLECKENRNHSSVALVNESVWSLSACPKCPRNTQALTGTRAFTSVPFILYLEPQGIALALM